MRAKSAAIRKEVNFQQQIQQQNQKTKILDDDRKNFWRQAEEIKEKNQEQIQKLRAQNKKLKEIRDQFISNKRSKSSLVKAGQNLSMTEGNSFNVNTRDENYLRKLLDKERHMTKIKKNALFTLQDKLKEVEENKLGYIEENPLMRNIRILQNRLDKVMIKYNQAQSIQKTYEEVVKRLKEERVGYDSQLAAIENSLKGREHDFEELLLLAHDATHAKQAAHTELKRFQQRRITVQEMRNKYLATKKQQVKKDVPQTSQMQFKQGTKVVQNKNGISYVNNYRQDQNYQKQQLQDYEDAFRKLKEVTGVIDANQIIQKFKTQGLTTNSLDELKDAYKNKIQALKQEKAELKRNIQQNKLMKDTKKPQRRRLDQIENQLAVASNQLERNNIKSQRLSNVLINIKAGIDHLKDLSQFYKRQAELQNPGTIEQNLKILNDKLSKMYQIVKNDKQYMKRDYKPNANTIHNLINQQHSDYIPFNKEEEESQPEFQDNFLQEKRIKGS